MGSTPEPVRTTCAVFKTLPTSLEPKWNRSGMIQPPSIITLTIVTATLRVQTNKLFGVTSTKSYYINVLKCHQEIEKKQCKDLGFYQRSVTVEYAWQILVGQKTTTRMAQTTGHQPSVVSLKNHSSSWICELYAKIKS